MIRICRYLIGVIMGRVRVIIQWKKKIVASLYRAHPCGLQQKTHFWLLEKSAYRQFSGMEPLPNLNRLHVSVLEAGRGYWLPVLNLNEGRIYQTDFIHLAPCLSLSWICMAISLIVFWGNLSTALCWKWFCAATVCIAASECIMTNSLDY